MVNDDIHRYAPIYFMNVLLQYEVPFSTGAFCAAHVECCSRSMRSMSALPDAEVALRESIYCKHAVVNQTTTSECLHAPTNQAI